MAFEKKKNTALASDENILPLSADSHDGVMQCHAAMPCSYNKSYPNPPKQSFLF
jgi:hypothetical protein